jgi:hypothetical protein
VLGDEEETRRSLSLGRVLATSEHTERLVCWSVEEQVPVPVLVLETVPVLVAAPVLVPVSQSVRQSSVCVADKEWGWC